MSKKLSSAYLWGFLLAIIVGLTAFFYETFIGFPAYINSLPENNSEGLGIIAILVFGIWAMIVATLLAVMSIIAYVVTKKRPTENVKGVAVFGIVVLFLLATGCIFYGVLMTSAYLGGWVGKIIYFGAGIVAILLAILNSIRLTKLKNTQP